MGHRLCKSRANSRGIACPKILHKNNLELGIGERHFICIASDPENFAPAILCCKIRMEGNYASLFNGG
jgi:hypothetical protein